ncbi:primosomal protein N' [Lapidilactobacillus mulanensis]|uniref:Replication restart protein PriA n=1 Tax=Lapidilactobacillus mulanensis TaxID=2485999 RepID=A0ABW4DLL1_9LACO|nr:primosomal protein N' [Lapidilactobacillus mulanensis]
MTVAQVIIDIPAQQTNRPFDYEIPQELEDIAIPGVRVLVPFGCAGHLRQGFIWHTVDHSEFSGKLKPIAQILDLDPVLNSEMLSLADWLATDTFSFLISCLQTMLPSALRANYQRRFYLNTPLATDDPLNTLLDSDDSGLIPDKIEPSLLAEIKRLERAQQLRIEYQISQRTKIKQEKNYTGILKSAEYEQLRGHARANAVQQIQLLTFLSVSPSFSGNLHSWVTKLPELSTATLNNAVKKGWLKSESVEIYRQPESGSVIAPKQVLTDEQQAAYDAIIGAIQQKQNQTFLLEGVTGSGKTEVYLDAMAYALHLGKTALMLVPEISLTPQMVERVQSRFPGKVAVLHSGLSVGERYDEWRRIERGEATVVVGARSAAFAPLTNIGIMIMDEEHEGSYKQDDMPRYHARDVIQKRAETYHCPVVLGSATPSLESRARAQKGRYQLLRLTKRPNDIQMPTVNIVDMRQAKKVSGKTDLSLKLIEEVKQRLDKHEQSVLLLNRRGYANFVMCRDCGNVIKCPNCDISLTLHRDIHALKCHYCGHQEPIPNECPACHSHNIRDYGAGTQKVEQEIQEIFPEARILRMDVDTTSHKGGHQQIISKFGRHEADILLGTQMIAKGLDFPDVTLVGVINADTSLSLPDFRASERTFQLLTQVSGRAGRAEKLGEVYIQTFNPDNYAIQLAARQDYETFYQQEMRLRHQGGYPPYFYTILISVNHRQEDQAVKKVYQIQRWLQPQLSPEAIVLGPTPRMITRVNNQYYYQLIIKYKNEPRLLAALQTLIMKMQGKSSQGFQLRIDREPLQFM